MPFYKAKIQCLHNFMVSIPGHLWQFTLKFFTDAHKRQKIFFHSVLIKRNNLKRDIVEYFLWKTAVVLKIIFRKQENNKKDSESNLHMLWPMEMTLNKKYIEDKGWNKPKAS